MPILCIYGGISLIFAYSFIDQFLGFAIFIGMRPDYGASLGRVTPYRVVWFSNGTFFQVRVSVGCAETFSWAAV